MKKQLMYLDKDIPIQSGIDQDTKDWEEIKDLAQEVLSKDFNGEGGKAQNKTDSGRRCPRCSDLLRIKEVSDNGTIIVMCWQCHATYHTDDLNAWEMDGKKKVMDQTTDQLYRQIPDELVNHYMRFFEKTKG